MLQFKSRLEELTNGRATLENFPNGQLGAELPAVQSVLLGTVDMRFRETPPSAISSRTSASSIFLSCSVIRHTSRVS